MDEIIYISMTTIVEFHREAVKIQEVFFITNEYPERICLYLVRQFEGDLAAKIGQILTKTSFTGIVKKINAFN